MIEEQAQSDEVLEIISILNSNRTKFNTLSLRANLWLKIFLLERKVYIFQLKVHPTLVLMSPLVVREKKMYGNASI